jgi:hypothetical protein
VGKFADELVLLRYQFLLRNDLRLSRSIALLLLLRCADPLGWWYGAAAAARQPVIASVSKVGWPYMLRVSVVGAESACMTP